jgi:hypothetical protein
VGSPGGSCIGLPGGSRSGGDIGSWSGFVGVPGPDDMRIFPSLKLVRPAQHFCTSAQRVGLSGPTRCLMPLDQSFLSTASVALLAASFTAAFASPVAF